MKREREKHITRLHIILFFFVVIVGLIIFFIVRHALTSNEKYLLFEEDIVNATKIYSKINNINVVEDGELNINIKDLDSQGLLNDNSLMKKCKGYVNLYNDLNINTDEYEIIYTPYIKCGKKYESVNYSDNILLETE